MALVVAFTAVSFDTNLLQVQYCQGRWHEGFGKRGNWQTSTANSFVEAHLKKGTGSSTVTLNISKAIHKVAMMTSWDAELKASSLPGKCA